MASSSFESFKSSPLHNSRTQDVFQSIVKGRKSWKTYRGGEVVWPPELEAALVEGLEHYQPDDSRETRLLGRFPMRNRFISDWIFEKTGKRRTAKQVGSRLQQLRDSCSGKKLLNLLSPNRPVCRTPSLSPEFRRTESHSTHCSPPSRYESESCSDSSASSPTTPTEAHATLQNLLYRGVEPRVEEAPDTIVYIDLLPKDSPMDDIRSTVQTAEADSWVERGYKVVRASSQPRHLSDIDPTITLLSQITTSAHSNYTVYKDGNVVFSESTVLESLDHLKSTGEDSLLYKTSLAPGFWETISKTSDASRYVIVQRVVQDSSTSSSPSSTIFSAMYRFSYASSSHADEHTYSAATLTSLDSPIQKSDYSFDTLLTMDPDFTDSMSYQKSHNFFDLGPYPTWSTSSTESGYSSPIDCDPSMPYIMSSDDEITSPTSPFPNYALVP